MRPNIDITSVFKVAEYFFIQLSSERHDVETPVYLHTDVIKLDIVKISETDIYILYNTSISIIIIIICIILLALINSIRNINEIHGIQYG